ncbi:MAG: HAD-IIB family hydrolase [Candidatus Aenigmarchaeota archaeon]|nr:HAD-IIB family hydrolase [Candidatus Aenigmarchaeota archaeon]
MNNKKLIIFDLDGTLSVSKTPMDKEMSELLVALLRKKDVAVISGGSYAQFEKQFLKSLDCPHELLKRLHLFPTCSTSFYRYQNGWKNIYQETLAPEEKKKIVDAFTKALPEAAYVKPETPYGDILEDRDTQITFSGLGQQAPIELKEKWDPDHKKRLYIKGFLDGYLPQFEVTVAGTTSIDVTRKGIDKAYGIAQMVKHLRIRKEEMLFVGDALFEGGNDYPVRATGVECVQVANPEETKRLIRSLIS